MNSDALVDLRRELHRAPEISEQETATAARVAAFLGALAPGEILTGLGRMGTGVAAVYDGARPGPTVVLRCELDALLIDESRLDIEHRSRHPGKAHKCGHDGHMAVLCGVAASLGERPLAAGRAVLLFQPAEEIGTGAAAMLADPRFRALAPDFIFGAHNVPRYPLGEILVRSGCFAAASVGVRAEFSGKTSHSSYPECGVSPLACLQSLVERLRALPHRLAADLNDAVLTTVTALRLGACDASFGVAPGEGLLCAVLRAYDDDDLARLKAEVRGHVERDARRAGLDFQLSFHEEFPATHAGEESVALVRAAAREAGLAVRELETPFRWSEDFAYYTQAHAGAFFGLGAGLNQPQLHHDDYDFPDELIAPAVKLHRTLLDKAAA